MSKTPKPTEPFVHSHPPQTKIVCSLRPSTDLHTIKHLLLCGMNVARIVCALGTQTELELLINRIRDASTMTKRLCGIILETHNGGIVVGPVSNDADKLMTVPSSAQRRINLNRTKGLQSIASTLNISPSDIPQNILENASFAIQNIITEEAQTTTDEVLAEQNEEETDHDVDALSFSSLSFGLEVTKKPADRVNHVRNKSLSLEPDATHCFIQPDIYLETDSIVRIITDRVISGDHRKFSICFPGLCNKLSVGKRILIHPSIKLEVIESDKSNKILRCKVLNGGPLKEYSKVEFPSLSMKWGITQQDVNDIGFAVQNHVDYICISKVKSIDDITTVKEMVEFQLASHHLNTSNIQKNITSSGFHATEEQPQISLKVLAKIEDAKCLSDIEQIITESDGIMIDEMPLFHSYAKHSDINNMYDIKEELKHKINEMMIATKKQAKPVAICCEIKSSINDKSSQKNLAKYAQDMKLLNELPNIPINPASFLTQDDIKSIETCILYNCDSICLLSDLNRFKQIFKSKNQSAYNKYWRSMDDDMLYVHGLMRSIIDTVKQKERQHVITAGRLSEYYNFVETVSCRNSGDDMFEFDTIDENEKSCNDIASDQSYYSDSSELHKSKEVETILDSMASSAVKTACDLNCALIIVFTQSGRIARIVSKYRPHCAVLTITDSEVIARQCMFISSIFPILVLNMNGTDSLISRALYIANKYKLIKKKNEKVVVLAGDQSDILDEPCDFIMKLLYVDL